MSATKCVEEHRRRSNGPLTCEDCRIAEIAAAEERGFRRGVEERDGLRTLLRAVRPLVSETFLGAGAMTERGWESLLNRIDAAIEVKP